mgnify:CR=1 FL=1
MTELDPVIHVQARLRIMALLEGLGPKDSIAFAKLQQTLEVTSGNLATHLKRLEENGYVSVSKVIEGRSPVTYVALTDPGRLAFAEYKTQLRSLLN